MNDTTLKQWTADELLAELRRRERSLAAKAAGTERSRAATAPAPGRAGALEKRSSAELAKLAQDRQRVIYGVDNRKDIYKVKSVKGLAAAKAVGALVKAADLTQEADDSYTLTTQRYGDAYQLCGSEPFVGQPLGCFCSGFLVAPDVVATAGHCVKSAADLRNIRFVFGFRMLDAERARTTFPADDVYEGASLIGSQLTTDGVDWALVQLARAVVGPFAGGEARPAGGAFTTVPPAAAGHTFSPRGIREVVPGTVYLQSGFEFTEYYFVVSADRRELIAIDAGTRSDTARTAHEALRARVQSLPPLTCWSPTRTGTMWEGSATFEVSTRPRDSLAVPTTRGYGGLGTISYRRVRCRCRHQPGGGCLAASQRDLASLSQDREGMKREYRLYLNNADAYAAAEDEASAYRLLVERVETIIAEEQQLFWQAQAKSGGRAETTETA